VLFQIVSKTQPNMALYYFLLHFWLAFVDLFGVHPTELVVRFPSAIFSAIDTLILYFLARRFFGSIVAIFAALFYLLNTLQLTYAQETRAYTLQLFFLSLSWFALIVLFSSDLSRKRARNWWICFVLSSTLAMYSQLFSELVLATQALAIALLFFLPNAWRARIRKQALPLLISWGCIGLLSAPILHAERCLSSFPDHQCPKQNSARPLCPDHPAWPAHSPVRCQTLGPGTVETALPAAQR